MQSSQAPSFRPLEYWKPPKAVRHIRAKSSALFSPATSKDSHSFVKLEEGRNQNLEERAIDKETGERSTDRNMSFATIREMGSRRKDGFNEGINMTDSYGQHRGPPPEYKVNAGDSDHSWYDVRHWGKKAWGIVAGILVVLIVVIIVAAVEATKSAKYPDYTALSYTLSETCLYPQPSFLLGC
jgi:hypothetical protein